MGKIVVDYAGAIAKVFVRVPPPTLPQLLRDGDELMDRIGMPEADPDSVDVPDDVEPGE